MDNQADNPYSVSPGWEELAGQHVGHDPDAVRWETRWDRVLVTLTLLISVIGGIAATVKIESIVISGGSITAVGLLLYCREKWCHKRGRTHWPAGYWLAIIGPAFAITICAIINLADLSPRDATDSHIGTAVFLFGAVSAIVSGIAFFTVPKFTHSEPSYTEALKPGGA